MEATKKYLIFGIAGAVAGIVGGAIYYKMKNKKPIAPPPGEPPLNASGNLMLPTRSGGVWCNCTNGKQCMGTWSGCPCCSGTLMTGAGKKLVSASSRFAKN